jgi:hypothetical protein
MANATAIAERHVFDERQSPTAGNPPAFSGLTILNKSLWL